MTDTTGATETTGPEAEVVADPAAIINEKIAASGVQSQIVFNLPTRFYFRKDKLGNKRADVNVVLPVPTVDGILEALKNEKQRQFLLDIIADQVRSAAKDQVDNESKPVNKQDELDLDKLTLAALAEVPASERRGRGIPKETWEAFSEDYIAIMPAATNKTSEQVAYAAKLFVARLQPCKTNKPILNRLKEQLDMWLITSARAEEFTEIYEFLDNKIAEFLAITDEQLLANL